jgi:hypothetical protein
LSADESATLREQLIGDLNRLQSSEDAADWVHRNLAVKNTLMAADADSVEASFRERVLTLEAGPAVAEGQRDHAKDDDVEPPGRQAFIETMDASAAAQIILPQEPAGRRRRRVAAKSIRLRDGEHCRYLTTQPCVVCGRTPSEAHHIRFAQPRALGRKVSDEYTVPVCRLHYRELHGYGDEAYDGPKSASTCYPSPLSSGSVSMRLRRARHSKLVVQTNRRPFERPRDRRGARGKWAAATVTNIMRCPASSRSASIGVSTFSTPSTRCSASQAAPRPYLCRPLSGAWKHPTSGGCLP